MNIGIFRALCGVAVLACAFALPAAPVHALPIGSQGVLRTQGGGPVVDGNYVMVFSLYENEAAKATLWQEVQLKVVVGGGLFATALGAEGGKSPLADDFFAQHPQPWLGVAVGSDPELPRQPLWMVPTATYAVSAGKLTGLLNGTQIAAGTLPVEAMGFNWAAGASKGGPALDLQCSGCIQTGHLSPDVLKPYAKISQLAAYAQIEGKNTFEDVNIFNSAVGFGKTPQNGCMIDVASAQSAACMDGIPALWTKIVADAVEMDKAAVDGQLVYRKDDKNAYMFKGGKWRKILFEAICGDKVVEVPEECDDGNAANDDSCTGTCKNNVCGDGFLYKGIEECDDKNVVNTDACVACKLAKCGDGFVLQGGETCDGSDLAGQSCASVKGASYTGVLACAADCKAFDTKGCKGVLGSADNPALSCKAILDAGASKGNGLYTLNPGGVAFDTYCDMTVDGGGWTLVASVHENNMAEKCGPGDKWSSTKGNAPANAAGDGNWQNLAIFGAPDKATADDYKNPAYANGSATNVMLWHVPNGTTTANYYSTAILRYFTADGFLKNYGNSMYNLYKNFFPIAYNGGSCGQTGPSPAVTYDKGNNALVDSLISPNVVTESDPGFIHFRVYNNEKGCNALCAGIKYTGCNTEHGCIGGGGYFPEGDPKQCGDFSGWDWDGYGASSGWSASKALTESAVFIFYR